MKETKVYVDDELLKYTDLSLCCTDVALRGAYEKEQFNF